MRPTLPKPAKQDRFDRLRRALKLLEGATVLDADVCPIDSLDGAPALFFRLADGTMTALVVAQDDEGNGPGALIGLWKLAESRGI